MLQHRAKQSENRTLAERELARRRPFLKLKMCVFELKNTRVNQIKRLKSWQKMDNTEQTVGWIP